jgi:hypothetical protein
MKTLMTLCCVALTCATALAADDAKRIETLLHRFLAGVSDHDRSVHEWFWSEELVYTASSGQRFGKAEILAPGEAGDDEGEPEAGPSPQYRADDVDIRVYGETAVLAFRLIASVPAENVGAPTTMMYYNTGTLVKRDGDWSVVAWQATRIPEPETP